MFGQLRLMRAQVANGEPLRPGNGAMAAAFVRQGIIRAFGGKGTKRRTFEFTQIGWIFANRESLWNLPTQRGDMHSAARHWSEVDRD
jgi:hypothetical protein